MCTIGENNTRLAKLIDRAVDMGDVYPICYIHVHIHMYTGVAAGSGFMICD